MGLLIAGTVIAGAIVAGMLIESGTLMAAAVLASLGIALVHPGLGLVVLALMGPLRPPPVVPAPGFNLILVGAILLGCIYQMPTNRSAVRVHAALLLMSAFVLYAFVQQLPDMASGYSGPQSHDIGFLFYQLITGFGTIVAAAFVLRGRSPLPFLAALLVSATLAGLLGIASANGGQDTQLVNLMAPSDVAIRATGAFGNPNAFGQLVAYATALAAGWVATTHSIGVRAALLGMFAIMAYAASLSLSRGAIAALLAGLVALAFARSRALGFAAVGAALLVGAIGYPLFVEWRLTTESGTASSVAAMQLAASDEARLGAILAGPALFATSPIFGIGFGQYEYASPLVTDGGTGLVAHNWYGTVLAEQGLIGVVLWLLLLVAVALALRSRPAIPRSIGFAVFGAFVVGCLFLQPPTSFQMTVLPAIVLTASVVADWGHRANALGRRAPDVTRGHRSASATL